METVMRIFMDAPSTKTFTWGSSSRESQRESTRNSVTTTGAQIFRLAAKILSCSIDQILEEGRFDRLRPPAVPPQGSRQGFENSVVTVDAEKYHGGKQALELFEDGRRSRQGGVHGAGKGKTRLHRNEPRAAALTIAKSSMTKNPMASPMKPPSR